LPETAEQLYERAKDALRMPPLEEWDSFPFEGEMAPKALGRVHVCRWGGGSWWFLARPTRLPQLYGSFVAIWEDVLPPLPDEVWRENVETFRAALG
jgi:hypothetical protein